MEFGIFGGVDYQNDRMPNGWPRSPRYFDPVLARKAHSDAIAMYELADELGLDFLTVSEHHYGVPSLEPNALLMAAELVPRLKNARLSLLGPNIPMNNPVRIAEEVAMLDLASNGRLYGVALLRGTPNESLSYFTNPAESREVWEEAIQLILRCWNEPEPFGWEGVHYRFRMLALWPRPLTPEGPRVFLSGNGLPSVDFAVSLGQDIAISYANPEGVASNVARYREASAANGRQVGRKNVLYRNFVYVSESEEKAREECERTGFGSMNVFNPASEAIGRAIAEIGASGYSSPGVMRELLERNKRAQGWGVPRILGTPEQVYELIREYHEAGVGAIDFSFGGFGLPFELAKKNLELFCREVLPEARKLSTDLEPVEAVEAAV